MKEARIVPDSADVNTEVRIRDIEKVALNFRGVFGRVTHVLVDGRPHVTVNGGNGAGGVFSVDAVERGKHVQRWEAE